MPLTPCKPRFWATNRHIQTLLGHLLPSHPANLPGNPIEIRLPDGDALVGKHIPGLDHADSGSSETHSNVLYLFHGLCGSIASGYMRRTAAIGQELGWDVYLINHRGCGEGRGLARKPYHSGSADDLSHAIRYGRLRHPEKKHIAIGFSLSGNALLRLISNTGSTQDANTQTSTQETSPDHQHALPDAAISVNAPIDLADSARLLEQGLNRLYDRRFSTECRAAVRFKQQAGLLNTPYHFPVFSTLRDFDAIYTGKAAGFKSREDYYETCSTKQSLSTIQIPTVLLTAKDDPFIDYRHYVHATLPANVHLHIEPHGGHLGYLTTRTTFKTKKRLDKKLTTRRWLDYAIHEFLTNPLFKLGLTGK